MRCGTSIKSRQRIGKLDVSDNESGSFESRQADCRSDRFNFFVLGFYCKDNKSGAYLLLDSDGIWCLFELF